MMLMFHWRAGIETPVYDHHQRHQEQASLLDYAATVVVVLQVLVIALSCAVVVSDRTYELFETL